MSLLKNVLRKNTATSQDLESATTLGLSQNSLQGLSLSSTLKSFDARSSKSSGGVTVYSVRSIAESVVSFTSTLFGGQRVPKRRRPEVSRLGVPKWYDKNPPAPPEIPGTEKTNIASTSYTAAHASSRKWNEGKNEPPYLSLVLYSHAASTAILPRYYDDTPIRGELRLHLNKSANITSIDIWCVGKAESVLSISEPPLVQYHANLWDRAKGNPVNFSVLAGPYKGNFPKGKFFVFPFEFPPLPKDVKVYRPDSTVTARVPLPPTYSYSEVGHFSGQIKYYIGVNIKREGMLAINEEWNVPILYYPLRQVASKKPTFFPFISSREDWPFDRQEIGGWTITPFGGRGRFRNEMVEIEGLLGVQAPTVCAPGQRLRYSLLLWSKSITALEALSDPSQALIDVAFSRANTFGTDVLHPRNAARKNRRIWRLAQGRIWRTDDGPPETDEVPALREEPWHLRTKDFPVASEDPQTDVVTAEDSQVGKGDILEDITSGSFVDSDENVVGIPESVVGEVIEDPTSPIEDHDADGVDDGDPFKAFNDFMEPEQTEATVRLDGDVQIPGNLVPSFRFNWMGCEYLLKVTFQHPEYSHISPSGPGIYSETPIWIVFRGSASDGTSEHSGVQEEYVVPPTLNAGETNSEEHLRNLNVVGEEMQVPHDAVRAHLVKGAITKKPRPIIEGPRLLHF